MDASLRIVGIGASAGGIEALRSFFQHLPAQNGSAHDGLAIVVVLHLAPDRPSMLAEVLGRWTAMPVQQAKDNIAVEADHVYVIPPNALMTVDGGRLRIRQPTTPMRENTPIDIFFASLAADRGPRGVGIVLSGTGSDGALGLKAIRDAGGLSLAQGKDGSQPEYDGMPSAAIATGAVDLIVPVEAMPEHLLRLEVRPEPPAVEASTVSAQIIEAMPAICHILRNQVGHDFSGYKQQTFMRRVQRRMQFLALDLSAYVQRLRDEPDEVALLFNDLLIGVTSFFRDTETFDAVATTVIPHLFDNKGADSTVRIWVPGCATGEEAYSLAILLHERMADLRVRPKVQIFATDIDEMAIALARTGRYPAVMLKDVSPPRIQRFFVAADGTFQIRKEIRDLCTFSCHNVIRDPPFSRIDMVSCRNVLIYLDTELQARVIPAFHYSLAKGGYLLLGGSEMVTRHDGLFASIDKKHRIFQRRDAPGPSLPLGHLVADRRFSSPTQMRPDPRSGLAGSVTLANERILERYAPAFVVVNDQGSVLHFSSHTGRYLEPAMGTPSRDLISMARRGLRPELRAAPREAVENGRTVERKRVRVELDGGTLPITLTVDPLPSSEATRLFMVVFNEAGALRIPEEGSGEAKIARDGTMEQIEREVRDAREQLQATAEQYETALEELKSANEELQSVNEELQSTNEELETAKEEIQSMNEELQTMNAQLAAKVDELDRANSDLRNLFESTQVATIFVDRYLVIRSFTPAVAGIYNLIPSDQGRPLTDIASQIDYGDLQQDMRSVLDTLRPLERRIARRDVSTHYLMRLLPYREADNRVDGVLMTFVDVTTLVQAERHHRLLLDELNHRVRNMLTVVISLATQTLRQSKTLPEFSENFMGRVNALAAAYTLLSRDNWTDVPLRDVLQQEVRPFTMPARNNLTLAGPPLHLKARGSLAFGMVVHELITNAVKYGALSVPDGAVRIQWNVDRHDGEARLIWRWVEQNGPPVVCPPHRGFGLSLIERSLRHELKGEAKLAFHPTGLEVTLTVPFGDIIVSRDAAKEAQ